MPEHLQPVTGVGYDTNGAMYDYPGLEFAQGGRRHPHRREKPCPGVPRTA